jgi:hypothetical protein
MSTYRVKSMLEKDKKTFLRALSYGWNVSQAKANRIVGRWPDAHSSGYREMKDYLKNVNPLYAVEISRTHLYKGIYVYRISTVSRPDREPFVFFRREM